MNKFLCAITIFFVAATANAQHCRITVEGDGSTGSGTLVRKTEKIGTILTCAHLFSDSRQGIVVSIAGRVSRANLVRLDKANDLAVLEIIAPPCEPFPVGPDSPGPLTAGGFGPNNELRFIRGRITGYTVAQGATHRSTIISGSVRSGDSGGGVFDDNGRLVGVVWGQVNGESYVTCGEPVRAILAGVNEMACYGGQCYQGNCYGGQCGPTVITGPVYQGQVVRPPMPPQQSRPNNPALPSPPPAAPPSTPTAPPQSSHDNTGCECVPKWQAMSVRITNIEADISGIKNQKPEQPQPATINFLGVDDKVIATAQVVPGGTTNVKLPPIHMRVLDQRGAGYSTDYQPAPLGSFVTLPFGPVTQ